MFLDQHPVHLNLHSCLYEPGVAPLSVLLSSLVASTAFLAQTANENKPKVNLNVHVLHVCSSMLLGHQNLILFRLVLITFILCMTAVMSSAGEVLLNQHRVCWKSFNLLVTRRP